jgi:hypothetical protein
LKENDEKFCGVFSKRKERIIWKHAENEIGMQLIQNSDSSSTKKKEWRRKLVKKKI